MKIAICYKGVYKIQYVKSKHIDEKFLNEVSTVIENHKSFFNNLFHQDDLEYFFSTYETTQTLDDIYENAYKPICFSKLHSSYLHHQNGWACQLIHYKKLLNNIRQCGRNYDFYVFTRPDIMFTRQMSLEEIDLDKFNIVIEHLSGNCDDNFWAFPQKYINKFEECVDSLLQRGEITHAINHELNKREVPIHYIEKYIKSEKYIDGHKLFIFMRP